MGSAAFNEERIERWECTKFGLKATERAKMEDEKNLFAPGDVVRHAKGNEYEIVGRCVFEPTMVSCYVYRGTNGCTWARPVAQMEDGRFSLVEPSNAK